MRTDTLASHDQDRRRARARKLMREAVADGASFTALPDRRLRVAGATPEVAAAARELRAEIIEMLDGHRCRLCGGLIEHSRRLPVEGGGHVHERCAGRPPARG